MKQHDNSEASGLADSIHEMNNAAYVTAIVNLNEKNRQQAERIAELTKEVDVKQAKIDALMLEYCPEEMTQEQIDNWASHQRVVKVGEI